MTLQEAISILTIHQQWRKGADIVMIEPKELTETLDVVLDNHLHNQLAEASKMASDESWEGCDGCTEQDEVMYKNGYAKGYNAAIAEFPKEISDKEIEEAADKYVSEDDYNRYLECFKAGAKWYREQLNLRK